MCAARGQVSEGLRTLNGITQCLRRRRQEAGALSLASPEVRFEIDTETHDPLDVGVYQASASGMLSPRSSFQVANAGRWGWPALAQQTE